MLNKLTLKDFVNIYLPIKNYKDNFKTTVTDKISSYLFDVIVNKEYIENKNESYVWSVVEDKYKNNILLIPGKNREAKYVIVTTIPLKNKNEYVSIKKR
jgi:hypothetical protein